MTPEELASMLRSHEREDAGQFGNVMRELGVISANVDGLKEDVAEIKLTLRNLDSRQWEDRPSQAGKTPASSRPARALSDKVILGLVGAIVVLGQAVGHLVH